MGCISESNKTRKFLFKIVRTEMFEKITFAFVLISVICMTLEQPLDDPKSQKLYVLNIINIVVTVLFIVEMIIKIIVYGLIMNGPDSYLKNGWNILDCLIVIVSSASVVIEIVLK